MEFDSERRYYVYVWYVKETNEVFYVGKGTGKRCRVTKRKDNPKLNEMIKNFECDFKIVKDCLNEKEAFDLEIETIDFYRRSGSHLVNILDGGFKPPILKGIPKSEELKEKLRLKNKIYLETHPEERQRRSEHLKKFLKTEKGKEFQRKSLAARRTDDFKKLQSERSRKANNTPEYKEKQSEIIKEVWKRPEFALKHSGEHNHRAQRVRQYDLNGNFVKEYETVTQASIDTGINFSKISAVARGKRKTSGGYIWKYVNDKHITNKVSKRTIHDSPCSIPILQFDKSGNFIGEYKSIAEAVRQNNYNDRTNIISNLKGRTKSAYGFVWRYKHDNTVPSRN